MNHELFKRLFENCLTASSQCSLACLREEESYLFTRCAKLNHTSVIICKLAIKAMGGTAELFSQVCRLCIEICTNCAEECEKFTDVDHCSQSAAACRETVAECRLYLATVPDEFYTDITHEHYELY